MDSSSNATIHAGPVEIHFLVDADDSGGSVTVFECRVPPSVQTPAPHSHDAFEETIYGLEGVSTWTIDGRARRHRLRRSGLHPSRIDPRIREPRQLGRDVPRGRDARPVRTRLLPGDRRGRRSRAGRPAGPRRDR